MPRKSDAVPIGTAPCLECGHENAVFQNAKMYLYMRGCPGCGSPDQRNNERVQTIMFFTLKTGEGVHVERPRNVPENRPAWMDQAPEPAPTAALPAPEPVPAPVPIGKPAKRGTGGLLWLLAAVLGITLSAAGIAAHNAAPRSAA